MKRLSKMAYELRNVTIFFERMVCLRPIVEITFVHNRTKSRIYQILKKQAFRYKYYVEDQIKKTNQVGILRQYQSHAEFYHHEIRLILHRYYIRLEGHRGYQSKMTIIDEVANLPKNIEEMNNANN